MKEKKKRKPHQNLHRICPRLIIITRPDKRYLNFSLTSLKYIHYSLQSTCKKENIINNFIDNRIYKGTKYIKVTFLEKDGRSFYILENVNLKKILLFCKKSHFIEKHDLGLTTNQSCDLRPFIRRMTTS